MDLGTTITGLIILIIGILPFLIMAISKSNRKKKLLQSLNELAQQQNTTIAEYDIWSNSIIGISTNKHFIFAIRNVNNEVKTYQVNLLETINCRVINEGRSVSSFIVTDKIEIAFTAKEKQKAEVIIELYNNEYDCLTISHELQLAEKWCKIAKDKIV